jgi:Na+-translocating ferredoxin:NAD+ oxidoreductase RNF subunit RnfB
MPIHTAITVTTILIIGLVGSALAAPADFFTRHIPPAQDLLIFPSDKGEVVFSHSKHLKSLKEDECIRCHRIDNPTLKNIQSRFDDHRIAHAFCKGCHRTLEKGPTECHQCHNYKKSS